jgi:hypothetical protein
MENLQSKTPYNFKKSYGGTPQPQTPQDAPWLRGPSLKIEVLNVKQTIHGSFFKKKTGSYYYFTRHYHIAVKIKPLYLTNNTRYMTSNTTRVVQ